MSVKNFFLRFGDNKSPQISRTFLRILAEYKMALFCNSTTFVSMHYLCSSCLSHYYYYYYYYLYFYCRYIYIFLYCYILILLYCFLIFTNSSAFIMHLSTRFPVEYLYQTILAMSYHNIIYNCWAMEIH